MKHSLIISLKMLLAIAAGLAILHFWPLAAVPVILGLFVGLGLLALFLICLVAVGAVGSGVVFGLLAAVLAVLALLSPLLIPVAFLLGIIWLVKKLGRAHPRPPLAA